MTDGHLGRELVSVSDASNIGLWELIRSQIQLLVEKQTKSSQIKTMWTGTKVVTVLGERRTSPSCPTFVAMKKSTVTKVEQLGLAQCSRSEGG